MCDCKSEVNEILGYYPVFRYVRWLKKVGIKSTVNQNFFISSLMALFLLLAAIVDGTLFLKKENIGFFEHPAIWAFLILQAFIPFSLFKSIEKFLETPICGQLNFKKKFIDAEFPKYVELIKKYASRSNNISRFIFILFVTVGFIGFTWNSYQNQFPIKFLGFDFWDSINHTWGYWITRLYKFYLWVVLFPTLAHLQIFVLFTIRNFLINASMSENFFILAYHPDGCGGVRVFIDTSIRPIIPIMAIISILTLNVVLIHQKFDPTTLLGLLTTIIIFIAVYLIPASALRKTMIMEKKKKISKIIKFQDSLLADIFSKKKAISIKKNVEDINGLINISKHIKSLPNWPHFRFIIKFLSFIISPTFISILIKHTLPYLIQLIK